jgi:uncharacterized protein (TIGR00251 family)
VRLAPPIIQQDGSDVLVTVHVHPRASRNQLVTQWPDRITLRLTAPPVGGAANAACCAFLAACLDLPKSRLAVLRGETGRQKVIRIREANVADVLAHLQSQ